MAIVSWEDSTLAELQPIYAGLFDLWIVPHIYPSPHTVWCAKRVGEDTACINAPDPETLVELLREMACQCPRHKHPATRSETASDKRSVVPTQASSDARSSLDDGSEAAT